MILFADDIRAVFWIAAIPAFLSFLFAWAMLREARAMSPTDGMAAKWGGWRSLDKQVRRLIAVGFLFGLARFSEGFLILKAMDVGLGRANGRHWPWRCSACPSCCSPIRRDA